MRTPNYNFERQERDKAKALKKAEKAAAKAAKSGTNERSVDDHPAPSSADTTSTD